MNGKYAQTKLTEEQIAQARFFLVTNLGFELILVDDILYKTDSVEEPHPGVIPSLSIEGSELNNWILKNQFKFEILPGGFIKESDRLISEIGKLPSITVKYSHHYDYKIYT
jgi:hypothetical protein